MTDRLAALLRRARSEAGYTLPELLITLTILGIVLAALIGAWVTGLHAETNATRRYRAQQEVRVAVDKMRDELHCADQLTFTSAASVTLRLPAECPDARGVVTNVTYSTSCAGSRCKLLRNGGVVADYITTGNVFSYQAPSAASLGKLHVDLPVDLTPADRVGAWRLAVDIVLRNTVRA